MDSRALFAWLRQTPWLALLGAFGLIVLVVGIVQSGTDFISFPGWVLQAVGAVLFALFLLLVTFQHHQTMDSRLLALEGRADDLHGERISNLSSRVELIIDEANRALGDEDRGAILRVRPKVAAILMSVNREFDLGLDTGIKNDDPRRFVLTAGAFLLTAWPFLRDGHLEQARDSAAKFNKMRAEDRKKDKAEKAAASKGSAA